MFHHLHGEVAREFLKENANERSSGCPNFDSQRLKPRWWESLRHG